MIFSRHQFVLIKEFEDIIGRRRLEEIILDTNLFGTFNKWRLCISTDYANVETFSRIIGIDTSLSVKFKNLL